MKWFIQKKDANRNKYILCNSFGRMVDFSRTFSGIKEKAKNRGDDEVTIYEFKGLIIDEKVKKRYEDIGIPFGKKMR